MVGRHGPATPGSALLVVTSLWLSTAACTPPGDGPLIDEAPSGSDAPPPRPSDVDPLDDASPDVPPSPDDSPDATSATLDAHRWLPVLRFAVVLDADGAVRSEPQLSWPFLSPAMEALLDARDDVTDDSGRARLWARDGRVLAEGPIHVQDIRCVPGDLCGARTVEGLLAVPDSAEEAQRLEVVEDGEVLVTIERGRPVSFVEVGVPGPGELSPPVVVSWQATGGSVFVRLLPMPGASEVGGAHVLALGHPPTGSVVIEVEHLYPGDGGVLELIVSDGLAFERRLAGPYRSGLPLEVGWRVFNNRGPPLDDIDVIDLPLGTNYLLMDLQVGVRVPGSDAGGDDVRAAWISDRDGDLAAINLDTAPDLYVPTSKLSVGAHTLTLELEVDTPDGVARHAIEVELYVHDG